MKKIKLFILQFILLFPLATNALKTVNPYNEDISGLSAFEFNTPIMTFLNISAFLALIYAIIEFMRGYTIHDLASGNIDELKKGTKKMAYAGIALFYIIVVFIIDIGAY